MDKVIFEVEISRGGPKGYETATVMKMLATWAEIHDALQKARITDARSCNNELTCIHYPGLSDGMIGRNVNLYELNLLAQRLVMLDADQDMSMGALLKMEQAQKNGVIPLERLINLTFQTDACRLAPHVTNHRELGALLYESEMLSKEATALLDTTDPDSDIYDKLLEVFGEQHQEAHGGVFTSRGYAEMGKDAPELSVYKPGEMVYFQRSGAPVVLQIRKGYFGDPAYDNENTVVLDLPTMDAGIRRALEAVDAASPEECSFRCVDCLIPSMRCAINDTIEYDGSIDQANAFAELLAQKERVWGEEVFVKYKALLAASGKPDLQYATELMENIEQYIFQPEVAQPWGYAEMILREKHPDLPAALFQTPVAAEIGRAMLEDRSGVITDYGLIRRKDGQPIQFFQTAPDAVPTRCEQNRFEGGMSLA